MQNHTTCLDFLNILSKLLKGLGERQFGSGEGRTVATGGVLVPEFLGLIPIPNIVISVWSNIIRIRLYIDQIHQSPMILRVESQSKEL